MWAYVMRMYVHHSKNLEQSKPRKRLKWLVLAKKRVSVT